MGLTFDLANPFAVVSEVAAGGLSHAAGVRVGDHLVRYPLPRPGIVGMRGSMVIRLRPCMITGTPL